MKKIIAFILLITIYSAAFSQNDIKTVEKSYSEFENLYISDGLTVTLHKSKDNKIVIKADSDGQRNILVKLKKGVFTITESSHAQYNFTPSPVSVYKHTPDQKVDLYAGSIKKIILEGGAKLIVEGVYDAPIMVFNVYNDSEVTVNLNCEKAIFNLKENGGADISGNIKNLKIDAQNKSEARFTNGNFEYCEFIINNKSQINAAGKCKKSFIDIKNFSRFSGLNYYSNQTSIKIENSSDAFIKTTEKLNYTLLEKSKLTCAGGAKSTGSKSDNSTLKIK